jgi:hypothetical protein
MKKITFLLTLQITLALQFVNGQTFLEKKLVTPNDDDVKDIVFFDIDQDNDIDIIAMANDEVFWYKNTGDQTFSNKILLISGFASSSALKVTDVDVDADGIEDILFYTKRSFCLSRFDTMD